MSERRKFPDVSFVDKDTQRLVDKLISAYEIFTDRTLAQADPVRLFLLWISDIIMQERVIIDMTAKQNVPRFAEDELLDSLAELFRNVERLQLAPARTTLRFHISAAQAAPLTIPRGTRATNGEVAFETTAPATVLPGNLHVDAPAVCMTLGAIGNGITPGGVAQIVDLFPFFESVENITQTEGGADTESDQRFYERMGESLESFSTAGSVGAYRYWVKTASQAIVDVEPTSPEPGEVDIRVLLDGGAYPDEEMKQLILETLDGNVPMTDKITVGAPYLRPFNIDVTYFITRQQDTSKDTIIERVDGAVDDYKVWQTGRMGRDINPDKLLYRMISVGAKRVEISEPSFEVLEKNEVAALVNYNVVFGGVEDE